MTPAEHQSLRREQASGVPEYHPTPQQRQQGQELMERLRHPSMRCDWAGCTGLGYQTCGQWWHCERHWREHLEQQRETTRPVRSAPALTPLRVREDRREYKRAWMAAKREREKASA